MTPKNPRRSKAVEALQRKLADPKNAHLFAKEAAARSFPLVLAWMPNVRRDKDFARSRS